MEVAKLEVGPFSRRISLIVALLICVKGEATKPSKACLELLAQRGKTQGLRAGLDVAFDEQGVVFKKQRFQKLSVEYDVDLDTVIYRRKDRIVSPSAFVPLFHGNGAQNSHSGAMFSILNILTAESRAGSSVLKGLTKRVQGLADYVPTHAVAWDFPFHGAGPSAASFNNIDNTLDWIALGLKRLNTNLPIVPVARSGSSGLLIELNLKYPGLLSGMILVSPVHPTLKLEEGIRYVRERAKSGSTPLNEIGLNWIVSQMEQMRWQLKPNPFGGLPTLILFGAEDAQSPVGVRRVFQELAGMSPDAYYLELPRMGHDVLSPVEPDLAFPAYEAIYRFIRRSLERKRGQ